LLSEEGIRLYDLCYSIKDIKKTFEESRRWNSLLIAEPALARRYGQRRIAFVHAADGYVVEFQEDKEREPVDKG
jgi:hypothetical protein